MAKTYADIQKEIAALQKAAEVLKQKEVSGVIDRIKAAIASYGLTAADLGLAAGAAVADKPKRGRKPGPAKVKKAPGTAVYRDEAGHTWTGRGRRPGWFVAALAAGKQPEELKA